MSLLLNNPAHWHLRAQEARLEHCSRLIIKTSDPIFVGETAGGGLSVAPLFEGDVIRLFVMADTAANTVSANLTH